MADDAELDLELELEESEDEDRRGVVCAGEK